MRNIFIAIPNYLGTLNPHTRASLDRAMADIKAKGWKATIFRRCGDSVITRCRNVLLAEFLASKCDTMICLDDDIAWDGDELIQLIEYDEDFVGGVYRTKREPEEYFVRWRDAPELWADPRTGLLKVEGIPAGFLKLSRFAVEKMTMAYPELAHDEDTAPGGQCWALFDFALQDHRYWGEDFMFCKRWQNILGDIWIAPELRLHHVGKPDDAGNYTTFTGCIGDWLRSRMKEAA